MQLNRRLSFASQAIRASARAILTTALCLGLAGQLAVAADFEPVPAAEASRLADTIRRNTTGKVKVNGVRTTPVPGIYQIESEGEIFYVDRSGRYGFTGGTLLDLQQQLDLTASQLDRALNIPFADLPLQHAIKEVRGNGRRKLAVFEDPNCPICKVFTKFVDALDDVTVYRFMFPVIDPKSVPLARMAWCSPHRAQTWRQVMAGVRPQGGRQDCNLDGLQQIIQFAEVHAIQNTPTVILANGRRLVGATPPEQFVLELDAATR